jgi:3-deoxy-7-phosphoheptulonate synthase
MALAAAAAGADALMIEVHPDPDNAWCDGAESLTPASFGELMPALDAVVTAVGRQMHPTAALV